MRAAIITEAGATPIMGELREIEPQDGAVTINVETATLGGWDVLHTAFPAAEYPWGVMSEGVGRTDDGRRVYFGEHSIKPWGGWSERTLVPAEEVWEVPDDVDDRTAITMAIAGTGAYLPLRETDIAVGDRVLIVGATGAVGQLALQFARMFGAGLVVGAARNAEALERLTKRGIADAVLAMSGNEDADRAALMELSGGAGFNVVLHPIGPGDYFFAPLKATAYNARIHLMGVTDWDQRFINGLDMSDIQMKRISVIGTGHRPVEFREQVWRMLMKMANQFNLEVDYVEFEFDQITDAWKRLRAGSHGKIVTSVNG